MEQVLEGKGIAHAASAAMYNQMGGDRGCCGFAWVEVYVDRTNSKQAQELIKAGFRKDYKPKCLSMWNPGDVNVQNVDIKEAGAWAMANYLNTLGLKAYAGSRLD
jgi:4-hydroxyphenylpyruvate dioxygenase-like putative hemolysin